MVEKAAEIGSVMNRLILNQIKFQQIFVKMYFAQVKDFHRQFRAFTLK